VIEKILKDRLTSIELYEGKLKKDSRRIARVKKSENTALAKKAVELDNSIEEVLKFTETYKEEVKLFLSEGLFTMDVYQEKLARYDVKFYEVLKFIQKKEDEFNIVEA
jgi:hypothetical protein